MSNKPNDGLNEGDVREYKALARNSFYSFLNSYSGFFFSMLTSFIMARILTDTEWEFLILTLSIIAIFTLILTFLPPSLGLSFNYYLPRFRTLKQNNKLKSFIKYSLLIRLICIIPMYIVSVLIFIFFANVFQITLNDYVHLLYILSPLIIINGFDKVFQDITRGLNLFKFIFILLVVRYLINIGGLLFLLININYVSLEIITVIILVANLTPFIINYFIVLRIRMNLKKTEEEDFTFKETLNLLLKYGIHLSARGYLTKFRREMNYQITSFFTSEGTVVGYNIARHYSDVSFEAIGSFNRPLTVSFSSLDASNKFEQIEKIYKIIFKFTIFFVLIITGLLFFLTDIYISIIYTETRLKYSLIVKLLLIAMIFNVQSSFFYSLLRASDKVKYIVPLTLLNITIKFIGFIIGIIFFGITGAIIAINICNIWEFIILTYFNYKIFKIGIEIRNTILMYGTFFISLALALILEGLILSKINIFLLNSLNLTFFKYFQFLSLTTFIIILLFLTILFKIFSRSDISKVEIIFNRDAFIDKIIRRNLKILKKVIRN